LVQKSKNLGITLLYSFDVDLNIRIFFKNENIELEEFRSQALNSLNLDRKESAIKYKRVSFVGNDSLEQSPLLNSLDNSPNISPRKTINRPSLPKSTRRRNNAIFNRNIAEEEEESETTYSSSKVGWGFYLVTKIKFPADIIPV